MKKLKLTREPESRTANYDLLKAFEAFEQAPRDEAIGTCGNIKEHFDPKLDKDPSGGWSSSGGIFGGEYFYDAVSAPFLLAKLVAAIPGLNINAEGQEGYKVTWTVVLRHKETGHIITFYDYKGASSFGSSWPIKVTGKFKTDLTKLLKALADPAFPHPYDGCRIGEIA